MAAAWVKFRYAQVVEKFGAPNPESWKAYNAYPAMWKTQPLEITLTLHEALKAGQLIAQGRRSQPTSAVEAIPSIEWHDLILDLPETYLRMADQTKALPWHNILVSKEDVLGIWPEGGGVVVPQPKRSPKNWDAVERCVRNLRKGNSQILTASARELADTIHRMVSKDIEPAKIPGNRSLRAHISKLRSTGQLPPRKSG